MKITKSQAYTFIHNLYLDNARTMSFFESLLGRFGVPDSSDLFGTSTHNLDKRFEFAALLRGLADAVEER